MAKSIMDKREGCWMCGSFPTETHHCWHGTANRKVADWDGLTVKLCRYCHEYVHSHREADLRLMAAAEYAWLKRYRKTIPDFIKRYGKNVLEQDTCCVNNREVLQLPEEVNHDTEQ